MVPPHSVTDPAEFSVNFRKDLNPEQLSAVNILDGPVLVIAGAGSGKTRTLVYRVARLIQQGIDAESILLLTFTRKSAAAMLNRASELVGIACQRVAGGTFHGFAHGMLRRFSDAAGFPHGFTILDRTDTQDLLHLLARELELSGPGKTFPKRTTLASLTSKVANSGGSVLTVLEKNYPHLIRELSGLEQLFEAYALYKTRNALLDYDDLLLKWRDLLAQQPRIRDIVSTQYRYIMVDEYQDTNTIQAEILRLMAVSHDNVMVVGDDAQSIYSFRGANFKNILDFPKLFPGATVINLVRNYRSTQPNLDCTNAIIANAREKFAKRLIAQRTGGKEPYLYVARDERDQAVFVADRIEDLLSKGIRPHEIAVLFRAAFHSFHLEGELNTRRLPFIKRGGLRLIEGAHIKDLLSLLRLVINPLDRLSCNRILILMDRLGPKTAEKIFAEMAAREDPLGCLAEYKTRAVWGQSVRELGCVLKELHSGTSDLQQILEQLRKWYQPHMEKSYPDDYPKRNQGLDHLMDISNRYGDAVSMLADLAIDPPEPDDPEETPVILSTIHSAKGLEWKSVFMISLADGRFPSSAARQDEELEEERRLFYVASTRAIDELYFCYPAFTGAPGSGIMPARPSPFLAEIPDHLMKPWPERKASQSPVTVTCRQDPRLHERHAMDAAGKTTPSSGSGIPSPGTRVRHPIFGPGKVTAVEGPRKVRVYFDVAGEKTLNLEYARLSILR
ncbi:MAG TPA: ATP-dependent helicase [Thermodesulfobacteriaceae bacterium]|nr:ATP-dependent helicase [Thermodesulfobacteriaceae bacterium]